MNISKTAAFFKKIKKHFLDIFTKFKKINARLFLDEKIFCYVVRTKLGWNRAFLWFSPKIYIFIIMWRHEWIPHASCILKMYTFINFGSILYELWVHKESWYLWVNRSLKMWIFEYFIQNSAQQLEISLVRNQKLKNEKCVPRVGRPLSDKSQNLPFAQVFWELCDIWKTATYLQKWTP